MGVSCLSLSDQDTYWMQQALHLAEVAAAKDEVPVGAILILNDQIVGQGINRTIMDQDPTAHAEMIALRAAAQYIGNYRLLNTTLYVTLEPCLMCAGALVHARIKRLVYAADEMRTGVIHSHLQVLDQPFLNHRIEVTRGVLKQPCSHFLSEFFRKKRKNHRVIAT